MSFEKRQYKDVSAGGDADQGVLPSIEHGCYGKVNLGRKYAKSADRLSKKHGKQYGVYRCPHCNGTHLTTRIENASLYLNPLLHLTT